MATSTHAIRIVLATSPLGNRLLRNLLELSDQRFEIRGLSDRSDPPTAEADDWRKQMYQDVATWNPQVVILSPAHSAETTGTCMALLELRPDLLVLAVPLGEKGEKVAVAYRKAAFVEEIGIDNLLPFILATCREDGAATGDDAR